MTKTETLPLPLDLTEELLVASTLLAMMEEPGAHLPVLRQMCAFSVERCQVLAEKLVHIDRATA